MAATSFDALLGSPLSGFGVEERLSWAEKRRTTRKEDKACSLLGVFDLFIPFLYGEGVENAFRRLKKAIEEKSRRTWATTITLLKRRTALSDDSFRYSPISLKSCISETDVRTY